VLLKHSCAVTVLESINAPDEEQGGKGKHHQNVA
jgi:hypothetical protein